MSTVAKIPHETDFDALAQTLSSARNDLMYIMGALMQQAKEYIGVQPTMIGLCGRKFADATSSYLMLKFLPEFRFLEDITKGGDYEEPISLAQRIHVHLKGSSVPISALNALEDLRILGNIEVFVYGNAQTINLDEQLKVLFLMRLLGKYVVRGGAVGNHVHTSARADGRKSQPPGPRPIYLRENSTKLRQNTQTAQQTNNLSSLQSNGQNNKIDASMSQSSHDINTSSKLQQVKPATSSPVALTEAHSTQAKLGSISQSDVVPSPLNKTQGTSLPRILTKDPPGVICNSASQRGSAISGNSDRIHLLRDKTFSLDQDYAAFENEIDHAYEVSEARLEEKIISDKRKSQLNATGISNNKKGNGTSSKGKTRRRKNGPHSRSSSLYLSGAPPGTLGLVAIGDDGAFTTHRTSVTAESLWQDLPAPRWSKGSQSHLLSSPPGESSSSLSKNSPVDVQVAVIKSGATKKPSRQDHSRKGSSNFVHKADGQHSQAMGKQPRKTSRPKEPILVV